MAEHDWFNHPGGRRRCRSCMGVYERIAGTECTGEGWVSAPPVNTGRAEHEIGIRTCCATLVSWKHLASCPTYRRVPEPQAPNTEYRPIGFGKPDDADGRNSPTNAVQGTVHAAESIGHAMRQTARPVTLCGALLRYQGRA